MEAFHSVPKRRWLSSVPPHEPSAAERIAEHTGHDEYFIADKIADALLSGARGTALTSGERALIAAVIKDHRGEAVA